MFKSVVLLFLSASTVSLFVAPARSQQASAVASNVVSPALVEDELRSALVGKVFWLRHPFDADSLSFDSDGAVVGTPKPRSFTLSGIKVNKVLLTENSLRIEGGRVGMIFPNTQSKRVQTPNGVSKEKFALVSIPGHLKIAIARNSSDTAGLSKEIHEIFTDNLSGDSVADLPDCWKGYFGPKNAPDKAQSSAATSTPQAGTADKSGAFKFEGGVSAPQVTHSVDPVFTEEARQLQYSGIVLLDLIVDASGKPTRIRILRPLGLGLDENAVRAVEQYRFQPARLKGVAVPVVASIEVNYRIYR